MTGFDLSSLYFSLSLFLYTDIIFVRKIFYSLHDEKTRSFLFEYFSKTSVGTHYHYCGIGLRLAYSGNYTKPSPHVISRFTSLRFLFETCWNDHFSVYAVIKKKSYWDDGSARSFTHSLIWHSKCIIDVTVYCSVFSCSCTRIVTVCYNL